MFDMGKTSYYVDLNFDGTRTINRGNFILAL